MVHADDLVLGGDYLRPVDPCPGSPTGFADVV